MSVRALVLLAALGLILGLCTFSHAAGPKYFGWKPPHASLPNDYQCAGAIPTTAEGMPDNATANATAPTLTQLNAFYANPNGFAGELPNADFSRVNGSYPLIMSTIGVVPSTDMIIRWAACKWGIDEDTLRAQTWEESSWEQNAHGDFKPDMAECVQPGFNALWAFDTPTGCFQSWGILQDKVYYFTTIWPEVSQSTAFAEDFRGANIRGCINGDQADYFNSNGTGGGTGGHPSYALSTGADKYAGCVATHYSGGWWDDGAIWYWNLVSSALSTKPWPGGM